VNLFRNLLVYYPFLQKKGEGTMSWTNVIEMTLDTKKADGTKVFPKKMSTGAAIKSAKKHLNKYLAFMKNYRATKPTHNSGGDNEPYLEILNGLEDLYDLYESFKNSTTEKRAAAADTRMRERAQGDAIRDASLGLFVTAHNNEEEEDDDDELVNNENDNPDPVPAVSVATTTKNKRNKHRVSTGSGRTSTGETNYQMIESIFKKYTDEKKEEKWRRTMEYNERQIALKEQRAANDCASRQMQHNMMMSLITHLSKK
jgi:hypothetical protein